MKQKASYATLRVAIFILVIAAAWGVAGQGASANELPTKTCLKVKAERDALSSQGYGSYLDQGPTQLKVRMTPTLLIGVKRLIYLTEIVQFRCNKLKMDAVLKRMNSPAFRRWRALNPPLPQRNPRFVSLKRR